jgi:hypothetical protein
VTPTLEPIAVASLAGLAGGLGLLVRGLGGYRLGTRIADTPPASIATAPAGEGLITGTVEPAEVLLVSPFQSRQCVYYRATAEAGEGRDERTAFHEERAVGFRVRDASGEMRVFPRGARWAVGDRYHEHTSLLGGRPTGLDLRLGPSTVTPDDADRAMAIAQLLTVRDPSTADPALSDLTSSAPRDYREARIEPGDTVTIVGFVQPFRDLSDPSGASDATFDANGPADPLADPAIAADLDAARVSGTLADSPEGAWGNAAIPGFGIDHPSRRPQLDPGAHQPDLADATEAARIDRTFDIPPEALVLSAAPDVPLLVTLGAPSVAARRENDTFLLGLVGAVIAIASAMALAAVFGGGFA